MSSSASGPAMSCPSWASKKAEGRGRIALQDHVALRLRIGVHPATTRPVARAAAEGRGHPSLWSAEVRHHGRGSRHRAGTSSAWWAISVCKNTDHPADPP